MVMKVFRLLDLKNGGFSFVCSISSNLSQAVTFEVQLFWDVTLSHWTSGSLCFKGLWCLHLQGQAVYYSS
jgi:hypothetical protein